MNRIVVTPRSLTSPLHPVLDRFREAGFEVVAPAPGRQPDETELIGALRGAVGYLAGVEPVTRAVLESASSLRAISRNGTGIDNIDRAAAERLGIRILRAEGANVRGVAELTLGHILAASRSIPEQASLLRNHDWQRQKGIELAGRTLGVIGCGRIGRTVTEIALCLGMKVRAFDPYPDASFAPAGEFAYGGFFEVLEVADVLSLHAPPAEDGRPILNAEAFSRMKRGVIVVNTARAELVDREAVLAALDDGTVGALTLDAFAAEPPADWSVIDHPRVIATPHIGGYTRESVDRSAMLAVENLLNALAG